MNPLRYALIFGLAISSCAPGDSTPPSNAAPANRLSQEQKAKIGRKIWQNESGGTTEGLIAWNAGEEFPSLGIGHFIWYPAGFNGRFEESWPAWIAYAKRHGAQPPAIAQRKHSPWRNRAALQQASQSSEVVQLRNWLAQTVPLQTDYIIARSHAALPKVLAAAPAAERNRIRSNYQKVATTPHGTYALIDYVNFKGDGTQASERYQGRGWGLLQVLGEMNDVPSGPQAAREFANSAKRVLSRRIVNSPPNRGEKRWEAGWHNRCDTYGRAL